MKWKYLFFCVFFCPVLAFAQKSYFDVTMGVDLPKYLRQGFSVRLGGGVKLGESVLAGAGIGVTKLNEVEGLYMPLSASFRAGMSPGKKVSPLVVVEPGYGFYNYSRIVDRMEVVTRGGFTFYGGAGLIISDNKSRPHLSVGYSVFTFKTGGIITRYDGMSIRAGLTLFNK